MGMRWVWWIAPLVLLAPAGVQAETHTDERLGFSVAVSDDWRAIPIAADEEHIVAKWQSVREYQDKEGWSFRPELKMVLFDPKGRKRIETEQQGNVTYLEIKTPYKTYKDWIKSDATGGRYISKEEEIKVRDVPTTWYEVAYEKLTVPRHGLAYVYHAADIDYCLTTEVLEQHWTKISPALFKVLKSFKLIARKAAVKQEVTPEEGPKPPTDRSKETPEERYERRQAAFEKDLRRATERLTDGWIVKRSKNYVALSHTDAKYTLMILDLAEAVREWAEENLGFYGTGIAGSEMLRICKDYDEERAIRDLSSKSGGGWSHEITTYRNEGAFGLGYVADSLFDRWLDDKNPRLAYGKPPWLSQGLSEWVRTAYLKGGKLVFRTDGDLYLALKQAAKANTLISPRDMLQLSFDEMINRSAGGVISGFGNPTSPWQQSAGFVRYLLEGPGKSSARTKDLLKNYVTELDAFLKAQDEKPSAGGDYKAPQTEAEEDERLKNRESYWKDHQKDMLKAVFDRVFKDWGDPDWSALEKSYKAYAN